MLRCENRTWSLDMLEIIGIDETQVPRLYESYEVIGNIKPDLAFKLGLRDDVRLLLVEETRQLLQLAAEL